MLQEAPAYREQLLKPDSLSTLWASLIPHLSQLRLPQGDHRSHQPRQVGVWLDFSPRREEAHTRRSPCRLRAQPAAVLSQAICGHVQGCLQLGQTENTAEHWNPGVLPILVVSTGDHRMLLETQNGCPGGIRNVFHSSGWPSPEEQRPT